MNNMFGSIVILLLTYPNLNFCAETVTYVAILYRHGDRTPVNPYPTDPWRNESFWPVKFGELTNLGKQQHYALGQWLRARYAHLLSNEFDPSQIYVRSTDVDRTLMSAQANLAGLYPPTGNSIWDKQLMWQPIPVHTIPEKDDELLAMKKHCIAYSKEKERLVHSKEYKERLSKYQGLMNYLTAYTGEKIKDYDDINYIYNTLYIETINNFTLPNWTHSVYPDKLREPSCYSFTTSTGTPLLARLKAGPILKEIVSHMKNVTLNSTSKGLKLSMYSAHDDTVGNVLNALGIFDGNCPVFTATILMELIYDNSTTNHYIRISYRNSTEIVEPYVLNIPYCGEKCVVERFIKLYDNLLTVNWDYECGKQFSSVLWASFFLGLAIFATMYISHRVLFTKVYQPYRFRSVYSSINPTVVTPLKFVEP